MNIFNDGVVPVMIDIETTDVAHTSRILSIAMVNIITGHKFYGIADAEFGLNEGRTTSASTMRWWKDRELVPQEAYDEAWSGTAPLGLVLLRAKEWMKKQAGYNNLFIVANPSTFDCIIVDNAVAQCKLTQPELELTSMWRPTNVGDLKHTLRLAWGVHRAPLIEEIMESLGHKNELAHGALADAEYQTKCYYEALRALDRHDGIIEPHVLDSIPATIIR